MAPPADPFEITDDPVPVDPQPVPLQVRRGYDNAGDGQGEAHLPITIPTIPMM